MDIVPRAAWVAVWTLCCVCKPSCVVPFTAVYSRKTRSCGPRWRSSSPLWGQSATVWTLCRSAWETWSAAGTRPRDAMRSSEKTFSSSSPEGHKLPPNSYFQTSLWIHDWLQRLMSHELMGNIVLHLSPLWPIGINYWLICLLGNKSLSRTDF